MPSSWQKQKTRKDAACRFDRSRRNAARGQLARKMHSTSTKMERVKSIFLYCPPPPSLLLPLVTASSRKDDRKNTFLPPLAHYQRNGLLEFVLGIWAFRKGLTGDVADCCCTVQAPNCCTVFAAGPRVDAPQEAPWLPHPT